MPNIVLKLALSWTLIGSLVLQTLPAHAWGLKTHVWVGQQVLNDALDDGHLTIAERKYPLPDHILRALTEYPDRYLMGHMGPDVFPDPIVGQTTTHPGVEHGWQTDDWLRHLLRNASNSEDIALTYGFVGHASGDIFAHTYVNAYTGSIFELTNQPSAREVERRHFVLEKYIEALTPAARNLTGNVILLDSDLKTATSFARDRLILHRDVAKQYSKVGSAFHLNAMYEVRRTVENFDREIGKVIGQLTEWGSKYLKEHAKLTVDLASAKHLVELAQQPLNAEEEALRLKVQAYEFASRQLSEVRDIVKRNPELITLNESLLIQQTKVAADALAEATRVAAEVNNQIESLNSRIKKLRGRIAELACNLLTYPPAVNKCKEAVTKLNEELSELENKITLAQERQAVAEKAANEAAALRDNTKRELDRLKEHLNTAARGLADKTYEGAISSR